LYTNPHTKFVYLGKEYSVHELVKIPNVPNWLRCIQLQLQNILNKEDQIGFQTSGSTGDPKKIWLKKKVIVASAQKTLAFFQLTQGHSAALILPAQFIGGAMLLVRSLIGGLSVHLHEPILCPKGVESVDFISCTPAQLMALYKAGQLDAFKGTILLGGSSLPEGIHMDSLNVYIGYGMTETASHVALRSINSAHYTALEGVTFSAKKRALVIHAPHLEISELITNDEVELLDNKSFKFIGRLDDTINSGGLKIHPLEIEQYFSSKGFEVYISAVPHKDFGEAAVLITQFKISKHRLKKILDVLPKNKRPKFQLNILEFPRVASGKIDRKSIRIMVKESQHLLSPL
jgi:o-succinylbenzoate---CoA ligase